jgi:hypothetical protein
MIRLAQQQQRKSDLADYLARVIAGEVLSASDRKRLLAILACQQVSLERFYQLVEQGRRHVASPPAANGRHGWLSRAALARRERTQ